VRLQQKHKQVGHILFWLFGVLVIAFWLWFFLYAPKQVYWAKLQEVLQIKETLKQEAPTELSHDKQYADEAECHTQLPKHGHAVLLSQQHDALKLQARFYAKNEHAYPISLTFFDASTDEAVGAVLLAAGKDKQMRIPVGQYQLEVQSGNEWCNFTEGFIDGEPVYANKLVEIKADNVVNLRVMSFGQSPNDIMLSFSDSLGVVSQSAQHVQGSGSMVLQPVVGGHFTAEGALNGKPINFLVDTGASLVVISPEFARHAGITECRKARSSTANGIVETCRATAKQLTLGQFTIKNVEVSYHKGLGSTSLLGMNVISLFKMEQQGDVMKLSR